MWPAVAVSPTGGDGTAEGLWEGIRVTDSPNLKGITGGAEYTGVDLMTEMFAVARRGLEHLGNDDPFRPVVAAFVTDLGLRLDRSRLVAVLAEQPPPRG